MIFDLNAPFSEAAFINHKSKMLCFEACVTLWQRPRIGMIFEEKSEYPRSKEGLNKEAGAPTNPWKSFIAQDYFLNKTFLNSEILTVLFKKRWFWVLFSV